MNFINTIDFLPQKIFTKHGGSLKTHFFKKRKLGQVLYDGKTSDGRPLQIRRFCNIRDDPKDLFDLHKRAFSNLAGFEFQANNQNWGSDLLDPMNNYMHNRHDLFVAYVQGKLVGIGAFIESDFLCTELLRLRVDPEFSNNGIGLKLKQVREYVAKYQYGFQYALTETSEHQKSSIHLAEKMGYKLMLQVQENWYASSDKVVVSYYHLKKL